MELESPAADLVKAVAEQKTTKEGLLKSIKQLEKLQLKTLESAHSKVLALNQEQANKYFVGSSESKVPFSERMKLSVQSLLSEIKKLEVALDLPSCNDDDFLQSLSELETKEQILVNLLNHSVSPKQTTQFQEITDYMKQTGSEICNQKFGSSALEKRHAEVQFNEMTEFENNYADILDRKDVDPHLTQQVRDRVKHKAAHTVQRLEQEARQVTKELGDQRAADTADIDSQYGRLLNDFIVTNENVSESYLERYKETMLVTSQLLKSPDVQSLMDRKTTSQSEGGGAPNYSTSAVVGSDAPSWKTDIQNRFHDILLHDRKCALLEAEIDNLLTHQMSESQVDETEGSNIDPTHLETLMSNLAALYVEVNEATLAVQHMPE